MRHDVTHRSLPGRARLALLLGIALAAASCTPAVHLRNPQTGQRMTCEGGFRGQGLGGILDGSADRLQRRCVDEYQQHGFVRVADQR